MRDTTPEILQKQKQIFLDKTLGERLAICLEMTDFARILAESRIKSGTPDITASELKAEIFRYFYKDDFPAKKLDKIAEWLKTEI